MRLPALLLLTLLCTCVRAQITPAPETLKTRIDTVDGPIEGYRQVRFVTVMPASVEMSKAEKFMRGLSARDDGQPWERLDSLIVLDPAGAIVDTRLYPLDKQALKDTLRLKTPYFDQTVVILEGKIGKSFVHQVKVTNPGPDAVTLRRSDREAALVTARQSLTLPANGRDELNVRLDLPRGSVTRPLVLTNDGDYRLEVRFVLNGHDISEQDFVATQREALADPWEVPAGRETLYLRLRSTEKLMTIYKGGKVYNKVAVGHQLDELNLSGLGYGDYLLEVIDLRTGKKRYHGLRRS